jgi:hypothetical protein
MEKNLYLHNFSLQRNGAKHVIDFSNENVFDCVDSKGSDDIAVINNYETDA